MAASNAQASPNNEDTVLMKFLFSYIPTPTSHFYSQNCLMTRDPTSNPELSFSNSYLLSYTRAVLACLNSFSSLILISMRNIIKLNSIHQLLPTSFFFANLLILPITIQIIPTFLTSKTSYLIL